MNIVRVGAAFCMGCCPNIHNGTAIAAPAVCLSLLFIYLFRILLLLDNQQTPLSWVWDIRRFLKQALL